MNQHTRLENNNVYTAIFAIDKIETLVKYYNYMKTHNPKGYKIAAIFTYQANQDMEESPDKHAGEHLEACMKDYNDMFGTDYDLSKFDAYRKDISKRMKQKDLPQVDLLLVVNMFLTGFDSKPTNTLFLDKNLVWHSLVQAYSRTNRVDKVTKQFGQIAVQSTLTTFSKSDWADLAPTLDEDEYSDFKSWYLYYYDKHKGGGKESVLVDVDFNIELVRTDKINVVYILNLLKDINRKDKDEMTKSVDLILREIERSDNEKIRYKRDIMKAFVTERFFELDPDADIIEAYNEYEREVMQADIESFSCEIKLDTGFVSRMVHEYFIDTKSVTKEFLRLELQQQGVKGLLRITEYYYG